MGARESQGSKTLRKDGPDGINETSFAYDADRLDVPMAGTPMAYSRRVSEPVLEGSKRKGAEN